MGRESRNCCSINRAVERVFLDPSNAMYVSIVTIVGGLIMGAFGLLVLGAALGGFAPFVPPGAYRYGTLWHLPQLVAPAFCIAAGMRRHALVLFPTFVLLSGVLVVNTLCEVLLVIGIANVAATTGITTWFGFFVSTIFAVAAALVWWAAMELSLRVYNVWAPRAPE